jgi:hypothetical protein
MKLISSVILSIFLAISVQSFAQNMDFPIIKSADMKVSEASYEFKDLTRVKLKLAKESIEKNAPYTKMSLHYAGQKKLLEITNTTVDKKGCMLYTANLPQNSMKERFLVSLTDYSTCPAVGNNGYTWHARVVSGFGWCGTMDSRMKLRGTP